MSIAASQITVTGTVGPGQALTAGVFTNVSYWSVDCASGVLTFQSNGKTYNVYIGAQTTFTVTMSGTNFTVAIS